MYAMSAKTSELSDRTRKKKNNNIGRTPLNLVVILHVMFCFVFLEVCRLDSISVHLEPML